MNTQGPLRHAFAHNIILRVGLYYAGMTALLLAAWSVLPPTARIVARGVFAALASAPRDVGTVTDMFAGAARTPAIGYAPLVVGAAILVAFVLAVPVAWTYMWTRRMKGYSQSMVHSLILLPVVVAGVVVLVKSSLALAFSLAGIVAAVRFRNTLDDSKDAVFIFFAVVLGLAAGVQADAAIVLSVLFIVIVLTLWYSDFARMPPGLEDARAQRQLERAVAVANRTSEFVARIDREVLQAMAPAQLDALAGRVRKRRSESDVDNGDQAEPVEAGLRVIATNAVAARALIEPIVERHCKRFTVSVQPPSADGRSALEYTVSLRKRRSAPELASAIEKEARPHVVRVEVLATIDS